MPVILTTWEAEIQRLSVVGQSGASSPKKIHDIWKCHGETPYIAISNKQKCLFSKLKDRKVKQVLSRDWHQ
jgi:hypothetical protein